MVLFKRWRGRNETQTSLNPEQPAEALPELEELTFAQRKRLWGFSEGTFVTYANVADVIKEYEQFARRFGLFIIRIKLNKSFRYEDCKNILEGIKSDKPKEIAIPGFRVSSVSVCMIIECESDIPDLEPLEAINFAGMVRSLIQSSKLSVLVIFSPGFEALPYEARDRLGRNCSNFI